MRSFNKIFEIGSPKTGTSSLHDALKILGLRVKGYDRRLYLQCLNGDFEETFAQIERFDAFEDGPWHDFDLYKQFDTRHPGSKFILLERDVDDWIKSHEAHFSAQRGARGVAPIENYNAERARIIEDHLEKYAEAKRYFANRPDDLLVMDISAGEGWEMLCPFLGLEVPAKAFPFSNRNSRLMRMRNYAAKLIKRTGLRRGGGMAGRNR